MSAFLIGGLPRTEVASSVRYTKRLSLAAGRYVTQEQRRNGGLASREHCYYYLDRL